MESSQWKKKPNRLFCLKVSFSTRINVNNIHVCICQSMILTVSVITEHNIE